VKKERLIIRLCSISSPRLAGNRAPKLSYDPDMKRARRAAVAMLACAGFALGQSASFIEVQLPEHVDSRNAFLRYNLSGGDTGGWIAALPDVSVYRIKFVGSPLRQLRFRAVFYAPGCDIDTLDIAISPTDNPTPALACRPVQNSYITGKLTQTQWLDEHSVDVEARYVSQWAASFLHLATPFPVVIRLSDKVPVAADGTFHLPVPQLSRRDGIELQLWAIDHRTGDQLAHLYPESDANTHNRTGSVDIDTAVVGQVAFEPCMVSRRGYQSTAPAFIRRDAATPVKKGTAACQ
jgi:hypothetical protein